MKTIENILENINKIKVDDFGRPSGILLIDKPANISSHDVVNQVRQLLHIKQVGHGGALDVFASGLEIVLVGKATKLSEELLVMNKSYQATVLFGVSTETQDTEGKVQQVVTTKPVLTQEQLENVLKDFDGIQEQYVSPFSSVKINGKKLRKILRDPAYSYKITDNSDGQRILTMTCTNKPENNYTLILPKRKITLSNIQLINFGYLQEVGQFIKDIKIDFPLPYCEFSLECTKGTYIRQLAEDIGTKVNLPSTLIKLKRTSIGPWKTKDAITIKEFENSLISSNV